MADEGTRPIRDVMHRLGAAAGRRAGTQPQPGARVHLLIFVQRRSPRGDSQHMQEGRRTIAKLVAAGQELGEIDGGLKKDKVAIQLLQAVMARFCCGRCMSGPAWKAGSKTRLNTSGDRLRFPAMSRNHETGCWQRRLFFLRSFVCNSVWRSISRGKLRGAAAGALSPYASGRNSQSSGG